MRIISSSTNPRVKDLARLHDKKVREQTGLFLVEGYHLVEEAKRAGVLEEVWLTNEKDNIYEVETTQVSLDIIQKISTTNKPQPIVGVCRMAKTKGIVGDKVLLLDDVSDPGNLGTLIRSAAAFHVSTIVLSPNSVDCYNDKVIRATQGALFFSNLVIMEIEEAIANLKERMIPIIGTSLAESKPVSSLDSIKRFALILGNEARGVDKRHLCLCDLRVRLDMSDAVESLNVAVAGSILLFYLNHVSITVQ